MRALITGGAGFIGSHLARALCSDEAEVAVVDDFSNGDRANLPQEIDHQSIFCVDVLDKASLATIVAAVEPDVIFHLAAQVNVRSAVTQPAFDARVNVEGTVNVLEAARSINCRVVFACTGGALYGESSVIPTPEDSPLRPLSPYGASKAAAEAYCDLYHRLHKLSVVSMGLANVYGPGQFASSEAGVVPIFCAARRESGRAVIFGDGLQTRDFVYVADVIEALLLAGHSDCSGAINIGSGTETSILELAEALELTPEFQTACAGDVRRSCLDPRQAGQRLGWTTQTSLSQGLSKTLEGLGCAAMFLS